jgi:uncharacterized surface protein with fasciclin (FAS1) repeats
MSNSPSNTGSPSKKTVVDTAVANGSFKTFSNALRTAGMVDTLQGKGPFTLFAPTDAAFDKLPKGQLENLLKPENKDELVALLNYHVLAGRSSVADVSKMATAMTINGLSAPIELSGTKVIIDGALVTAPDIASSNGVLHGIDKVNIPTRH